MAVGIFGGDGSRPTQADFDFTEAARCLWEIKVATASTASSA